MALSFGDAIKAGQNFDVGAYKAPAGFDVDFFRGHLGRVNFDSNFVVSAHIPREIFRKYQLI